MPQFALTLTGADTETSQADLCWMLQDAAALPTPVKVEFGILWSNDRAGQRRYPDTAWIERLADSIPRRPEIERSFSLHICGQAALNDFFAGTGAVSRAAQAFPRIQLNLVRNADTALKVIEACRRHWAQQIITQSNAHNARLIDEVQGSPNHAILFDSSGGRGQSPESWPEAFPGIHCGFAGGLSPQNLWVELPRIRLKANGAPFWIDMESSLRGATDAFDLDLAWQTIKAASYDLGKAFKS